MTAFFSIAVRLLINPKALMVLAGFIAGSFVGYKIGHGVGFRGGERHQAEKQAAVNVIAQAEIKERIKNALDQAGAVHSADDIDAILRGLAPD